MKRQIVLSLSALLLLTTATASPAAETLAEYPVRWKHGGTTDYGRLIITTSSIQFINDEGEDQGLPFLYLDEVRIVDDVWIQVRSNRESGMSFGLNDVYNFGVVGAQPDVDIIARVNELIVGTKEVRIQSSARLPGERARYMVSKGEVIGDDVGLLIITDDALIYRSDTGGKDHNWQYSHLRGVEIDADGHLHIRTSERSLAKLGISYRNYEFISQTRPFAGEHIGYLIDSVRQQKD